MEETTEEIGVTIDPDGEGGMPPITIKAKLEANAYFWFGMGFILGFLVGMGVATVV